MGRARRGRVGAGGTCPAAVRRTRSVVEASDRLAVLPFSCAVLPLGTTCRCAVGLVTMHVTVVTDSTAYLPAGFAQRHRVRVVPLHVAVDGRSALDGVDLGPAELATVLSQRRVVTTSRPSPAEFIAVYRELLDAGAEAVVSVHLSRKMSGTW